MIDLRQLREDARKTQQEMADYLGVSQPQYGRYEKDPESMPLNIFLKLTPFLGDMNRLMNAPPQEQKPLDAGAPYGPLFRQRDLLIEYLRELQTSEMEDTPIPYRFEHLEKVIHEVARKPNLGVMGRFDAGKTHLVNTLLGRKVFVTKYRPTTSLITVIKHIEERPEGILETVDILDADNNSRMRGNLGLLNEFGVHRRDGDDEYDRIRALARTAIVYLDAPILKSCNLIDVPGYQSHDDDDREKANAIVPMIDILVFMTPVVSGLDANDLIELSYLLRALPKPEEAWHGLNPLDNWFLVFSHADPGRTDQDMDEMMADAAHDITARFGEVLFAQRYPQGKVITSELIRRRSYLFWSETSARREPLFAGIKALLGESLPIAINQQTTQVIELLKTEGTTYFQQQAETWRRLIEARDTAKRTYETWLSHHEKLITEYEAGRQKVQSTINHAATRAAEEYATCFDALMSVDVLEAFLGERFSNPKNAQTEATSVINEQLMEILDKVIQCHMGEVATALESFLSESSIAIRHLALTERIDIPLDLRAAFWAGVGSTAVGGGLAVTAAAAGNLGGYLLVSQTVGVLSPLGVGFGATGGTAGAMAAVSAIGGPLTVGIALTAMTGLATWRLLSESWQLRLAKKISKHYTDNNMRNRTCANIISYFNGLAVEFDQRLQQTKVQYEQYLGVLRDISGDVLSRNEMERKLLLAEVAMKRFEGIGYSV